MAKNHGFGVYGRLNPKEVESWIISRLFKAKEQKIPNYLNKWLLIICLLFIILMDVI
jgi:hypothetical protein